MVEDKPRLLDRVHKRKQLEKDLEHISQEMYRRNFELAEINKTLSLLRTIDNLVLESSTSLSELCTEICSSVISNSDFSAAAILPKLMHNDHLHLSGLSYDFPIPEKINDIAKKVVLDSNNEWLKSDEISMLIQLDNISPDNSAKLFYLTELDIKSVSKAFNIKSIFVIKLTARNSLVGIMAVGFQNSTDHLNEKDQMFIERLSDAIGVAIDSKLLLDENQRIVKALQHSNKKLKDLDEAKDEFISMASHQLRTPLTSMKGYVSMVLEGDAGKINSMQRKLLDQAFISSQRMVYLIADLLNVSRLRTGKFIIEAKPTNLADVVASEVSQLIETAKSRGIELSYDKPKTFPELMLDETKIRQVIMNFTDNAIYYTPSGGHIRVILEDKPQTIEVRVEDDGLGVPKSEQHHLFTKFFRAGNARKARPDGTGLGLFMAKKVIAAQGGAIIFNSTEGKGSTFGFSFAKSKLAPPIIES